MKKKDSQVIFDRNVIEFVTVAAEFCKFVEQAEGSKRTNFVDTTLKLLPLLYLKASMLPPCETIGDEAPETFVTEETYEIVRMNLAGILADRDDYLDEFVSDMKNPVARYLVAEQDGKIIGYAGAWVILDESHVTNIAVLKEHRGQGTGKRLTHGLLQYLSNLGAAYATLEVRRSNAIAQTLYKSLGFVQLGVRKRYYADYGEDALIMVCDHMPAADPDFTEAETVFEE